MGDRVLEVEAREGRGRACRWQPSPGQSARTPALVVPDVAGVPRPAWTQVAVTAKPTGAGIELVSGGTWFYPSQATGALVVPPPRPTPTTEVQVLEVGEEVAVFHDAGGWASNPAKLVPAFAEARRKAGTGRLLWAPALGTPADYAVWAYVGVDLFDASPLLLAAARGIALTPDGPLPAAQAAALHEPGAAWDTARLAAFNLEQARLELERIGQAIASGTLRALAERRAYTSAAAVEVLRRFDREHAFLEAAASRHRTGVVQCMTQESLWAPDIESFRRRLREGHVPPRSAKVLVLLPCSARKPYKLSRSHRHYQRVLDESGIRPIVHEVMVTSPLGLVPRELEETYPAVNYDIPVTGNWTLDEQDIVVRQLRSLVAKHAYTHVIVHTGPGTAAVLLPHLPAGSVATCLQHPTTPADLQRFAAELQRVKEATGPAGPDAARRRRLDDIESLASFQFNPAVAADLVAGADAHGRPPFVKLEGPEGQRAQTTPERGQLSLTMAGAAILARHGIRRVFIQDFRPQKTSSLFAVGVEGADPDVRPGDEVAVVRGGELRGCGVAQMAAEDMGRLRRGVAVSLRHTGTLAAKVPEVVA